MSTSADPFCEAVLTLRGCVGAAGDRHRSLAELAIVLLLLDLGPDDRIRVLCDLVSTVRSAARGRAVH